MYEPPSAGAVRFSWVGRIPDPRLDVACRLGGVCPTVVVVHGYPLRSFRADSDDRVLAQVVWTAVWTVSRCWATRWRCPLADRQHPGNAKFVVTVTTTHRQDKKAAHQRSFPSLDLSNIRFVCPAAWTLHWPNLSIGGELLPTVWILVIVSEFSISLRGHVCYDAEEIAESGCILRRLRRLSEPCR